MNEITFISIDTIDASIQACANISDDWDKIAMRISCAIGGLKQDEQKEQYNKLKFAISKQKECADMVERANDIKKAFVSVLDDFNKLLKDLLDNSVSERAINGP